MSEFLFSVLAILAFNVPTVPLGPTPADPPVQQAFIAAPPCLYLPPVGVRPNLPRHHVVTSRKALVAVAGQRAAVGIDWVKYDAVLITRRLPPGHTLTVASVKTWNGTTTIRYRLNSPPAGWFGAQVETYQTVVVLVPKNTTVQYFYHKR